MKVVFSALRLRGNSSWNPYPLGNKALRLWKTSGNASQPHSFTRHKNWNLNYAAV